MKSEMKPKSKKAYAKPLGESEAQPTAESVRETWPAADTKALFRFLRYADTRKVALMFACAKCEGMALWNGQEGDGAFVLACGCTRRRVER